MVACVFDDAGGAGAGAGAELTYQSDLAHWEEASIALQLPQKYGLKSSDMHALALYLGAWREAREAEGKKAHADLLRQEAVKWAKARTAGKTLWVLPTAAQLAECPA